MSDEGHPVPEPSTIVLAALGVMALLRIVGGLRLNECLMSKSAAKEVFGITV